MDKPIIKRAFSQPSAWTFKLPAVKELVERYIGDGKGWADPFAGKARYAEFTNDLDPELDTTHHLEAAEFAKQLPSELNGVLFDPPYSYRQISEHYRHLKKKATALDTSYNFYHRVMIELIPKIRVGGHVLSFGWNSAGFGAKHGFEVIEVLMLWHGMHRNDTICTVELRTGFVQPKETT